MQSVRVEFDNNQAELSTGLVMSFRFESLDHQATNSLLLLHGLNAHSGTWRKNIPYFAKLGWRVIAPTLPRTSRKPNVDDIMLYAQIVQELLVQKLAIREVNVVGNSMGGWIAMQLAATFPVLVGRLVLEDSAGVESELPEKISAPTLILWGEKDDILPVKDAFTLNAKIKNSTVLTFKTVGHVFHWENPGNFNRTVRRFLSE